MERLFPCLCLLLFTQTAFPCINRSGTKFNGEAGGSSYNRGVYELRQALKSDPAFDGAKMEADLRGATEFEKRSDYSAALMYLGRSREAVALLEKLEKEKPGQYFIAANLGTAYELSGDNEDALHWIKEGIRRDPESHLGTEWLHVKILEAKIAQQKDPGYFKTHSVLNLQPQNINGQQEINVGDKTMLRDEVAKAIQYQLTERLQFVKSPDPSVASLLFDYAAIVAVRDTLESAKEILKMSLEFGYPSDQVNPLIKLYDKRISWRSTKPKLLWAIGIGIFVSYIVIRWRKKKPADYC